MLALTPPLAEHLRRLAPDASAVGIDASNPAVWDVYRAGLEELFETMPAITGPGDSLRRGRQPLQHRRLAVSKRDGRSQRRESAGHAARPAAGVRSAGQDAGASELDGRRRASSAGCTSIRASTTRCSATSTRRRSSCPQIHGRRLLQLPAAQSDTRARTPSTPRRAPGEARVRRLSAFPDFLGEEHARALRALRAANPQHRRHVSVFTQFGGPLRAGPRTLYPLHGFWLWTDANVFVASRLAVDPDADVSELARRVGRRDVRPRPADRRSRRERADARRAKRCSRASTSARSPSARCACPGSSCRR